MSSIMTFSDVCLRQARAPAVAGCQELRPASRPDIILPTIVHYNDYYTDPQRIIVH